MKEIWLFIKWRWQKFELWQKWYIVGAFIFGLGFVMPAPYRSYVMAIPVTALFIAVIKWFVWDQVKDSWHNYKKEKSELFEVIKGNK